MVPRKDDTGPQRGGVVSREAAVRIGESTEYGPPRSDGGTGVIPRGIVILTIRPPHAFPWFDPSDLDFGCGFEPVLWPEKWPDAT